MRAKSDAIKSVHTLGNVVGGVCRQPMSIYNKDVRGAVIYLLLLKQT